MSSPDSFTVDEEEFSDTLESATSLEPDKEGTAAMNTMKAAMFPLCSVYSLAFRKLVALPGEIVGEEIKKKVDFVQADPPYNIRREWVDDNAWHEVISSADMEDRATMWEQLMNPGAQGPVFC